MFKKGKCKLALASACVMALVAPYATPVLAVGEKPYKQSDLTGGMNLHATRTFEYGTSYKYALASKNVKSDLFKVAVVKDDGFLNYSNAIFCADAEKYFPSTKDSYLYKNFGELTEINKEEIAKFKTKIGDSNFAKLVNLTNILYLRHLDETENKEGYDEFLNAVYKQYLDSSKEVYGSTATTLENIKEIITEDDVDLVEQFAIWYYTNNSYLAIDETEVDSKDGYKVNDPSLVENGAIDISLKLPAVYFGINPKNDDSYVALEISKQNLLNMMFSYLVKQSSGAKTVENAVSFTYPELKDTTPTVEIVDSNYVVGPFEFTEGTANENDYKIILNDGEKEISTYGLKDKSNNKIDSLKDTIGKEFYVTVPTSSNISQIRVGIEYYNDQTVATYWRAVEEDGSFIEDNQPMIWIVKNPKAPKYIPVAIEKSDLALRKYIVSVNGDASKARKPVVDATGLLNGETTAVYKHAKSPISVEAGDKIVYEIRVYNEGKTSATVNEIVDFIPEGLELVENSEINKKFGWKVENGVAKATVNKSLKARSEENIKSGVNTLEGGLDTTFVQMELKVKVSAKGDSILTNVAEIANANIKDQDSTTSSIKKEDININTFTGNKENKTDLNDKDYFYKGLEDDDDFEKVVIIGKVFDLAEKKFITSVNGQKVDREPKVDVKSLATSTNATYTMDKTPVLVEQGDIVTYKIRVYNEGNLDAWAEEVADYIPEGLGFIVNHKVNVNNYWSIKSAISSGAQTVKLSEVSNAIDNVKLADFENTTDLKDVEVVKGLAKIKSNKLSSSVNKEGNLIKGFNSKTDKTLYYKDIEVACVVLADEVKGNNLKNIAEITNDSTPDDNGNPTETEDRDSTPDTVNPNDYPGPDKNQDDNDYEELTVEKHEYDLSLEKFITKLDNEEIKNRVPTVKYENGNFVYNHPAEALEVGNGQLVEYTIRVYNEGPTEAYAAKVSDNLPNGLKFVADNETNKKYGWVLVDKLGQPTTDVNQAVTVATTYLSKEASEKRGENTLLKAFDKTKPVSTDANNANPDYRDVKIVFQVNESVVEKTKDTEKRTLINIAEITEETDKKGRPVIDVDSTPNNWKDGEDDIDREKVYVKYFDLALKKDLVKVIVIENGVTKEYSVNNDQLFKVELNKKKLNSTVVKFVYDITVTNEGEIEGYAKEIKDYIPEGLEFIADDNQGWYQLSNNEIATNLLADKLLQPKESASVQVTLKWINGESNLGKKVNVAEISKDENKYNSPDIDSTPDNKVPGEDDIDDAPVILSISTGSNPTYYGVAFTVIAITVGGMVLIRKFVL